MGHMLPAYVEYQHNHDPQGLVYKGAVPQACFGRKPQFELMLGYSWLAS